MYLQKAGGSARGIFGSISRRGDDQPQWVGGTDDNPVYVGEYTHTGNYTPARRGDDAAPWVQGVGEYTHMGSDAKRNTLRDLKALTARLQQLSDSEFRDVMSLKGSARNAEMVRLAKEIPSGGTGLDMASILQCFLEESNRRAGGGGASPGGGGGGIFGTGISAPVALGVVGVLAVVGIVVSRLT